jgi:hypothetical protein
VLSSPGLRGLQPCASFLASSFSLSATSSRLRCCPAGAAPLASGALAFLACIARDDAAEDVVDAVVEGEEQVVLVEVAIELAGVLRA